MERNKLHPQRSSRQLGNERRTPFDCRAGACPETRIRVKIG